MSDARNPYAAPQSAVVDVPEIPRPGRPGWVWAITILYAWGILWGIVVIALQLAGKMPGPKMSQGPIELSLMAFGFVLQTIFAVQLFRLQRSAFMLSVATLVFGLANFAYRLTDPEYTKLLLPPVWIGLAISWAISIAIVLYVRSLLDRGVLR